MRGPATRRYVPARPGEAARRWRVLAPEGLVLGLRMDGGETFERLLEEETMPLTQATSLLLFTDGISEAMNACGRLLR